MGKIVTIKQNIQAKPAESWESNATDGAIFSAWTSKDMHQFGYTFVTEIDVTFEVPDGFDIRSAAIDRLNEEKSRAMAEFQKRITEIDKQIAQFTAIES